MKATAYISTGRKGVMFTLRGYRWVGNPETGRPMVEDWFIKNLSMDETEALRAAEAFVKENSAHFDFDGIKERPFNDRAKAIKSVNIKDLDCTFKMAKSGKGWWAFASETFFKVWKEEKDYLRTFGFSLFKNDNEVWMVWVKGDLNSITLKHIDVEKIEKKIEEKKAISQWQGEIKERLDIVATLINVNGFMGEDYLGRPEWKSISTLEDDNGNIFKYFNYINMKDDSTINVGDKVSFKGTVKKHDEYQGQKQTTLSRCSKAVAVN